MRKQGMAIGEIAQTLLVAKSSVSYWVRDIKLTQSQRSALNANGHSIDAIEKRRISRLSNLKAKRSIVMNSAIEEAEILSTDALWCIGIALYWGEGGKTQNVTRISNSDPAVICTMMRFFREICKVDEDKFHAQIHTFEHCDEKKIEKYWSKISEIDQSQFFKSYKKQSSASKNKRDTLPYGTFQVYVHDVTFFFRMMGWLEYLKQNKL